MVMAGQEAKRYCFLVFCWGVVCIVFVNLRAPEDMQTFGALALMADLLHWMGPPFPQHLNVPTPGLRPLSYPVTLVPHLSWVEPSAHGYRRLMILGGFNTGERFTVTAVDRLGWTIMAATGQEHHLKTNDPALQFVSHGYSETTDRAQGQTYPNVVAVLSNAYGEAANQARPYVQISRAAKSLSFVTNGTQLLAFKLNRQDGLILIASDEVRATREADLEG